MSKEYPFSPPWVEEMLRPNRLVEFQREYYGSLNEPTPEEAKLRELAEEYEQRCESYDQLVCGPDGMPKNGEQMGLINRHAQKVRNEILPQVHALGLDWKDFKRELSEVQRRGR